MAATREDAQMMIELAKWGAMIDQGAASRKIFSDDFDSESASALDPEVQTTLVWYESIGTLVKNELLDRDLVYDWLWVKGAWDRVGAAAMKAREASGVSELYANFEALAQGQD